MTEQDLNELEHYRQMYATDDLATKAYAAIAKMMRQQVDFMNTFSLKDKIKLDKKDSMDYERVMNIYESMPKMIFELHKLKNELNIQYVEKEERIIATTPQSVGLLKKAN